MDLSARSATQDLSLSGNGTAGWPFAVSMGWNALVPEPLCDCVAGGCCSPTFSVAWSGWWRPLTVGPRFNVSAILSGPDERLRVWLDNALLIDSWTSLTSLSPFAESTRNSNQSQSPAWFKLNIHYKQFTGAHGLTLLWRNSTETTASSTFSSANASIYPDEPIRLDTTAACQQQERGVHVRVKHAPACATTSFHAGDALTLSTAGLAGCIHVCERERARGRARTFACRRLCGCAGRATPCR